MKKIFNLVLAMIFITSQLSWAATSETVLESTYREPTSQMEALLGEIGSLTGVQLQEIALNSGITEVSQGENPQGKAYYLNQADNLMNIAFEDRQIIISGNILTEVSGNKLNVWQLPLGLDMGNLTRNLIDNPEKTLEGLNSADYTGDLSTTLALNEAGILSMLNEKHVTTYAFAALGIATSPIIEWSIYLASLGPIGWIADIGLLAVYGAVVYGFDCIIQSKVQP
jgi:hypothetical protein